MPPVKYWALVSDPAEIDSVEAPQRRKLDQTFRSWLIARAVDLKVPEAQVLNLRDQSLRTVTGNTWAQRGIDVGSLRARQHSQLEK